MSWRTATQGPNGPREDLCLLIAFTVTRASKRTLRHEQARVQCAPRTASTIRGGNLHRPVSACGAPPHHLPSRVARALALLPASIDLLALAECSSRRRPSLAILARRLLRPQGLQSAVEVVEAAAWQLSTVGATRLLIDAARRREGGVLAWGRVRVRVGVRVGVG